MAVRRDKLEVDVVFFESFFELVGAFVVENVELGGIAMALESGMEAGPCGCELAGLTGLEGLGEDGVAVVIVEYHDVIVATRRLDGEFSGLVRVGFV